jgi:hypothetical protein
MVIVPKIRDIDSFNGILEAQNVLELSKGGVFFLIRE